MSCRPVLVWVGCLAVIASAATQVGCRCLGAGAAANRGQDEQTQAKRVSPKGYQRVSIADENAFKGVFDPSVEYDADGRVGWMAYSALEAPPDPGAKAPNPQFVHTQLARTTDHGKTWSFVKRINLSSEATVSLDGKSVRGAWWHEVPSLLFDPDDQAQPWKLFWMKYFAVPVPYYEPPHASQEPTVRIIQYMWIAMKGAKSPPELATAPEQLLFDAGLAELPDQRAKVNVNTLHPTLSDRKAYTEPGTLYRDGVLYVSLGGFTGPKVEEHRLVLLASRDHGATWSYAGQLLEAADARPFGYKLLGASSLAEQAGRVFLMVSPMDQDGHHGTYVFEMEDLKSAKIRRTPDGKPLVHKYLPPSVPLIAGRINAGESSFHERNTGGGMVMPQSDKDSLPALGQIFNTGLSLLP